MSDIDPMADEPKEKSHFDKDFQTELATQVESQFTKPPETLSPEEHVRLDMEDAIVEERTHHWGHVLFAIFGFISVASSLAMIFVMSIAFTAGETATSQLVRTLADPSLALLLAYVTFISLILGLVGLGLGEWHHRTR